MTEILNGLVDTKGNKIGTNLAENFANDGQILLLSGQSTAGKTTVIREIDSHIEEFYPNVQRTIVYYDEALKGTPAPDTLEFNIWWAKIIQGIKRKRLVEDPACGKKWPKDRGVTTSEILIESEEELNALYLVSHILARSKTALSRQRLLEVSSENAVQVAKDEFELNVVSRLGITNPELLGISLQSQLKWSANPLQINTISMEVSDLWQNLPTDERRGVDVIAEEIEIPESYKEEAIYEQLLRDHRKFFNAEYTGQGDFRSWAKTGALNSKMEAAYMVQRFRKLALQHNRSEDSLLVGFNPFLIEGANIYVD